MTLLQKTAALTLFSALGMTQFAGAQIETHTGAGARATDLPIGSIARLPKPTAEYDGTLEIEMPNTPTFHTRVTAAGPLQRYEWNAWKFSRIFWADLQSGETVKQTNLFGKVSTTRSDLELPDFSKIDMKKIGVELINGKLTTIFETENAPIMKDHLFTGKIFVTDAGVTMLAVGTEKNTKKKDGEFKPMKITMLDYHEGRQNPDYLKPPVLPLEKPGKQMAHSPAP